MIPWENNIIDIDIYPPPTLVIEIAKTSLSDEKGEKRLLYEDINVTEYWIEDVEHVEILALASADRGSRRITQSQVLPGLEFSLLEEALRRNRQMNQSLIISWLLSQFQQ